MTGALLRAVGSRRRLAAVPAPQGDDARRLGPRPATRTRTGTTPATRRCCAGTGSTSSTRRTRSRSWPTARRRGARSTAASSTSSSSGTPGGGRPRDWLTQIGHDPDRASYPDLYRLLIPEHLWGDYDVPGLDRERHRAVGSADGSDRRRRQPLLQGLLPRDARPAPAHDRRRAVERPVRHRARRREHVHLVPLRDRRAPPRPVAADTRTAATARTRRSGRTASPARGSACSCTTSCAAPTTTRCSRAGGTTCAATEYLHLDGDELPQSGDALLRPDPRRAPRGAGRSPAWSRRSTSRRRCPRRRAACSRPA